MSKNSKLDATFYNFTQQLQGQLYQAMQAQLTETLPALPPLLQVRGGYAESPGWFMVQAAEFDPEPLTVAKLRVRDIYASERIVQALLELLAGERWLRRVGEAYALTENGRSLLTQLRSRTETVMRPKTLPMPDAELAELEQLLDDLIAQCLQHDEQPGTWCLRYSRNRAPQTTAPILHRIAHYFSDFNAFRDDAHMAAWQAEGVDAHAWEAFALVASGQADSAAAVYDALFFRGYNEAEYASGLQDCVKRGWLDETDGTYTLTDLGRKAHQEVEQRTDSYFYAPWYELGQEKLNKTIQALQAFQAALTG